MPRAIPAAVLSVVVEAKGVAQTAAQLKAMDAAANDSAKSQGKMGKAAADLDKQSKQLSFSLGDVTGKADQLAFSFEDLGKKQKEELKQAKAVNVEHQRSVGIIDRAHASLSKYNDKIDQHIKANQKLRGSVNEVNAAMTFSKHVIEIIKVPALISALGLAAQAASALGGGFIALTSAVAPAAGALTAYGTALTSAVQVMGVLKLATSGVGKALKETDPKKFAEEMKALPPAAQAFVKQIKDLKPTLQGLQNVAAQGLFPGVTQGIKSAMGALGPVRSVVGNTAKALGSLAAEAGKLVGGKAFGADIERIGNRNATIIKTLGEAGLSLADALRHVLVAAGPLNSWLAKMAKNFADNVDAAAKTGRETGKLRDFFDKTRHVLSQLGAILANVSGGLFNIGKAGSELGGQMLTDITKLTAKFKEWTESPAGIKAITKYFKNLKGPLREMGKLFIALIKSFIRVSQTKGFENTIVTVRERLLPALEDLFTAVQGGFTPALVNALSSFVELMTNLSEASGGLTTVAKICRVWGVLGDTVPTVQTPVVEL